jgi:hypothetical protein
VIARRKTGFEGARFQGVKGKEKTVVKGSRGQGFKGKKLKLKAKCYSLTV